LKELSRSWLTYDGWSTLISGSVSAKFRLEFDSLWAIDDRFWSDDKTLLICQQMLIHNRGIWRAVRRSTGNPFQRNHCAQSDTDSIPLKPGIIYIQNQQLWEDASSVSKTAVDRRVVPRLQ